MLDHVLACGDKLHVITRRLFAEDLRRHFVGEISRVTDDLFELQGYSFVYDMSTNRYARNHGLRTIVIAPSNSTYIVTKIPRTVELEALHYYEVDQRMVVGDSNTFALDVNEFGPRE